MVLEVLLDGGPDVRLFVPVVHARRNGVRLDVVEVSHGCRGSVLRRAESKMVEGRGQGGGGGVLRRQQTRGGPYMRAPPAYGRVTWDPER